MVSLPIVLLIFMSSDFRDGVLNNRVMEILRENNLSEIIRGQDSNPQVNNLLLPEVHLPTQIIPASTISGEGKKTVNEKNYKEEAPLPLYSLVKNTCEKGYILDANGICQKTVAARPEKEFDLDRRKRSVLDVLQKAKIPFYNKLHDGIQQQKVIYKILTEKEGKVDTTIQG